ncbi:MAG: hypothetical protein HZB12_00845 [Candidatus Yonathbacteria bacterium]|nr:hypothetical protein [Candidatus Yonathbacteria bacterium]
MVEMLIGASIFSIALFSISNFFQQALRASKTTQSTVQGDYLLEEGMEAAKIFRDLSYTNNFRNMSTTTTYYFSWNGTNWATTTTNTFIDGKFERKFTLADVKRDVNQDIASSGTYDPDIKLVTVSVAWHDITGTTTHSIQTYVLNLFNN